MTVLAEYQKAGLHHGHYCPGLAIGIPVKYIHTPTGVINYNDYENAVKLMVAVVKELNDEKVEFLRTF